jgi:hypothetical protein
MADFERSEGAVPRSVRIGGALSRTNPILGFPTHSSPNVLHVLDGHLRGVHFHCADFTFRELAPPSEFWMRLGFSRRQVASSRIFSGLELSPNIPPLSCHIWHW